MKKIVLLSLVLLLGIVFVYDEFAAESIYISSPDDLDQYFQSVNYTLENWESGDRSVPRAYLTDIPSRWRHESSQMLTTPEKKRYFFFTAAPLVLRGNELVMAQRDTLLALADTDNWSSSDRSELQAIADEYGLPAPVNNEDNEAFTTLLAHVDIVPVSMALAQAAIESGWGTSRFADEGNAIFGQWSWDEDAITPERVRTELGNYGIKSFTTLFESITAYMQNLNTHPAYETFRQLREQQRLQGQTLDGTRLAAGLENYSERGDEYVQDVRDVIRVNGLEDTDQAYLRDQSPVILEPVE